MNAEQVCQHQEDSHNLGVAPHKKVVSELGLFDSTGKSSWNVVEYAGGTTAFVGVTEAQKDDLESPCCRPLVRLCEQEDDSRVNLFI